MRVKKNEPKIKSKTIVAIREQLEHRASWLYLLPDEAKKRGLDPNDFAAAAIKKMRSGAREKSCEKGKDKEPERSEKNIIYEAGAVGI